MTTAYVDLPARLSAPAWRARHDRGEVPDATPWGLGRLADHGVEVRFREQALGGPAERVARSLRYRSRGLELVEAVADLRAARRDADVTVCYDERTGVPAALLAAGRLRAPVVTGVGWLTTRGDTAPALRRLAAAALPRAAVVWTQCAPVLDLLRREWAVSRPRFVPFGIDTDFYVEQPWPAGSRAAGPVVVSAGEDRHRDHDLLVRAVAQVRRSHPDVTLELATGLPVRLPAEWCTLHTGRLDGRMRELYRRASVVAVAVGPTVTGSGLSVVLEAMASGRPVVVTDNPGIADYVDSGRTGLLVPVGDEQALATAVAGLLADPDRARGLGAAAAREVRHRFTTDVMARELAALIRSA